jgi:hypothetical protein
VIVVDRVALAPLLYLIGHELGHAMKAQHKRLYQPVASYVFANAADWSDFKKRLTARKLLLRGPGRVGIGCGAETGCEGVCRSPHKWLERSNRHLVPAVDSGFSFHFPSLDSPRAPLHTLAP